MKKTYMTPYVEIMSVAVEQLLTASGLDTDELQETEVLTQVKRFCEICG